MRALPYLLFVMSSALLEAHTTSYPSSVYTNKISGYKATHCMEVDIFEIEKLRSELDKDFAHNTGENKAHVPFGLLKEDWDRLNLLQDRLPEDSPLKQKLIHLFRLVISAIYETQYRNSTQLPERNRINNVAGNENTKNNQNPNTAGDNSETNYSTEEELDNIAEESEFQPSLLPVPSTIPTTLATAGLPEYDQNGGDGETETSVSNKNATRVAEEREKEETNIFDKERSSTISYERSEYNESSIRASSVPVEDIEEGVKDVNIDFDKGVDVTAREDEEQETTTKGTTKDVKFVEEFEDHDSTTSSFNTVTENKSYSEADILSTMSDNVDYNNPTTSSDGIKIQVNDSTTGSKASEDVKEEENESDIVSTLSSEKFEDNSDSPTTSRVISEQTENSTIPSYDAGHEKSIEGENSSELPNKPIEGEATTVSSHKNSETNPSTSIYDTTNEKSFDFIPLLTDSKFIDNTTDTPSSKDIDQLFNETTPYINPISSTSEPSSVSKQFEDKYDGLFEEETTSSISEFKNTDPTVSPLYTYTTATSETNKYSATTAAPDNQPPTTIREIIIPNTGANKTQLQDKISSNESYPEDRSLKFNSTNLPSHNEFPKIVVNETFRSFTLIVPAHSQSTEEATEVNKLIIFPRNKQQRLFYPFNRGDTKIHGGCDGKKGCAQVKHIEFYNPRIHQHHPNSSQGKMVKAGTFEEKAHRSNMQHNGKRWDTETVLWWNKIRSLRKKALEG